VRGPSQERLIKIAGALADDVAHVRGTVDTFDGVTWQARLRRVSPLAPAARADDAFASDVLARTSGLDAGSVASPSGSIPIVVRISDRAPLERRVRLGAPELASDVQEEDGERVVRVTADLEHADLSTTVATIQSAISPIVAALPPGYRVDVGGAIVAQHTAFVEFASIFALALVLVFGVLLAAFDSFRLPFAILAAVPLAPLGVALALFVTKTNLDIASFMGMLLLVGIVVRNGILLVDAAQRRVREGASPREAIERAAIERLRPIVMTTLAALGALAPLAAGIGAGAEMERPLAVAVIGGIVVATTLTLVVVPLLYLALVGTPRIARDGGTRALGSDR
jgi:multidrug efflux pump subunit AcrB